MEKRRTYLLKVRYKIDECKSIEDGKRQVEQYAELCGFKEFDVTHISEVRTDAQNRALHLWFRQLADALNDAGYDMRKTIKEGLDIPWTPTNVKEFLWRPVQEMMTNKRSTTSLNKNEELDKVQEVVSKTLGERTGVYVPFPSLDTLIELQEQEN